MSLTKRWGSTRRLLLSAFLLGLCVGTARADSFPEPSVDEMCDEAELIIEGVYLGENTVEITRVHKKSRRLKDGTRRIKVARLDEHSRSLQMWRREDKGEGIETKKLVLFLAPGLDGWESLHTITDGGLCGSCGLYWFDKTTCYGYAQSMNPGPYMLLSAKGARWRIPENIEALRSDIKTGLANSRRWRSVLAIEDPKKKARALAKYLLTRTSPEGDKGTFLYAVREPMRKLGEHAVPVLVEVLEDARPEEKLNDVVLILYDIGPEARAAVPHLCKLLDSPEQAYTGYVLSALRTAGDPRAVEPVRPFLRHKEFRVAVRAAEVLAVLKDHDSFDKMAALVPVKAKRKDQFRIYELLNALHELDAKRAKSIIDKAVKNPIIAECKHHIKGLKDR